MSKSVYETIKRQNGEAFAQAIRRYDNGIFDVENLPEIVKFAGRNPIPLLPFLESLKQVKIPEVETEKSPFELLKEAGYKAFYANTLEKQNSIEPYYTENEALCTFMDKSRYIRYHIIHAIKEGAEQLKRSDFKGKEKREDEYGVSVLSIQILKEGGFISIKNRYNHGVENSDNTYNSNPDNIIKGLSLALKRHFNVDFSSQEKDLPIGYQFIDGKIYKYHTEREHIYFGDRFYIQNGVVNFLDKDFEIVVDDFVIDLKRKKVYYPEVNGSLKKTSQKSQDKSNLHLLIEDEIKDKVVRVSKSGDEKALFVNGNLILKAKANQLTHLYLPSTKRQAASLFNFHPTIEVFESAFISEIQGTSFYHCPCLKEVKMPLVKEILGMFMVNNKALVEVDFPSLEKMGKNSFLQLPSISKLVFFSLKEVGPYCLRELNGLTKLSAPQLEKVGLNSLQKLLSLATLELGALKMCDNGVISSCPQLKEIKLQKLQSLADYCVCDVPKLEVLDIPLLEKMGDFSLNNLGLKSLFLPTLKEVGNECLYRNKKLRKAVFLNLEKTGAGFLSNCNCLMEVEVPNLKEFQTDIFKKSNNLKVIKADSLAQISKYAGLKYLPSLMCLYAPLLDERSLFASFYLHPFQEQLILRSGSKEYLQMMREGQKGRLYE
ncbi:MAG: leucine-rich repeat protein [Alphaproteobacteria bacterium]|nr:leucine-rich repeat protein [Alphaproteobacteria bacterium]